MDCRTLFNHATECERMQINNTDRAGHLLTKSYRFISKCFFRAPPPPPPPAPPLPTTPPPPLPTSFSTSDTSCSRISNSFSPCNFFNTREDIFLHILVRRFTAHRFYFYSIFFGQFVDAIADARYVVDNEGKNKKIYFTIVFSVLCIFTSVTSRQNNQNKWFGIIAHLYVLVPYRSHVLL